MTYEMYHKQFRKNMCMCIYFVYIHMNSVCVCVYNYNIIKVCYYFYSFNFSMCSQLLINIKVGFLKTEPKVVVLKVLKAGFTEAVQHK